MTAPQSQPPIEIFDSRGHIGELSDKAYATLGPDRKARFLDLRAAVETESAAEAELKAATDDVAACARALQASQTTLIKLQPRVSAVDAAKGWIASQRENG
jgi:hypothetical protein